MLISEEILERSQRLGGDVDKSMAEARSYLSRAESLNQQLEAARKNEEREYARLVEAAASSGKLPELNGHGRWIYDSPSSKLVVAAVSQCHVRASAAAREAGPRIFEALQRRVKAVVDESAKLAATVPPGVVDEMSALHAGDGDTKHHTTWRKPRTLVDTWTRCFELLAVMQRATWVPGPSHPKDQEDARLYERYLRSLALPAGYWKGPGELRLARAAASNAEPGMYPWRDALERWERVDRRKREYRVFSSRQAHDGMGNLVWQEQGAEQPQDTVPVPIGAQPIVPVV